MTRLFRWLFSGLCLLSLLACLGTALVWWRSDRGHSDRLAVRLRGERYVLRSEAGRVTAWGLPRVSSTRQAQQAALRQCLARAGNKDLWWSTRPWWDTRQWGGTLGQIEPRNGDKLIDPWRSGLAVRGSNDRFRPLLDALEDPERFALAHVVLARYHPNAVAGAAHGGALDLPHRRAEVLYRGLRVRLPDAGEGWSGDPFAPATGDLTFHGYAADYDRSQMPALRDDWFDWFAQPVASRPHWRVLAPLALPPMLWLSLRARRKRLLRRRRRLGLCLRCGYDLTGNTSGRCSECGEAVTRETAA